MTWGSQTTYERTCPKCGAVYKVTSVSYPARERGEKICSCGKLLQEWHGSTDYLYELKKPAPKKRAAVPAKGVKVRRKKAIQRKPR